MVVVDPTGNGMSSFSSDRVLRCNFLVAVLMGGNLLNICIGVVGAYCVLNNTCMGRILGVVALGINSDVVVVAND